MSLLPWTFIQYKSNYTCHLYLHPVPRVFSGRYQNTLCNIDMKSMSKYWRTCAPSMVDRQINTTVYTVGIVNNLLVISHQENIYAISVCYYPPQQLKTVNRASLSNADLLCNTQTSRLLNIMFAVNGIVKLVVYILILRWGYETHWFIMICK